MIELPTVMVKQQRVQWIAGIYKPDGAIAKLWNTLSDGERHSKKILSDAMQVKNPVNRWYWIKRDGIRHKKNQTYSWTIHEDGGAVQMRELKAL
jgi:hypothetical protein